MWNPMARLKVRLLMAAGLLFVSARITLGQEAATTTQYAAPSEAPAITIESSEAGPKPTAVQATEGRPPREGPHPPGQRPPGDGAKPPDAQEGKKEGDKPQEGKDGKEEGPKPIRRPDKPTGPGNPEVCNIYTLHKYYSSTEEQKEVAAGCTTAAIGCLDCKGILAKNIIRDLEPIQARIEELSAKPELVRQTLIDGAERCRGIARRTMEEVRAAMGIRLWRDAW